MKGTIREIVGQESGFIIYPREAFLDNWSSNLEEYDCDLRKTRKIKNCLYYLIESGFVQIRDDEVEKFYREDANPVTLEDLMVEGLLYELEDFIVLVPEGWN